MSDYKILAKQSLIYGLGTILPRFLNSVVFTFIYTRILDDQAYGVYTLIYSYAAFVLVFLTFGMETTLFRFISKNEEKKHHILDNIWWFIIGLSGLFIGIMYVFMDSITHWMGDDINHLYLKYFVFFMVFDALSAIIFAKLRLENKLVKFALLKLMNIGIFVIGLGFFFYFCDKNMHLPWVVTIYDPNDKLEAVFFINLIASFFVLLVLLPEMKQIGFQIEGQRLKELLIYAFPLMVAGFAGQINELIDRILLKELIDHPDPLGQLGIYGANYKMGVIMVLFIQMFRYAAEPFFFKKQGNTDDKIFYGTVTKYFYICCLCIFLMVTLYIDVFKYFIGEGFRDGLYIVPIVLLGNLLLGLLFNVNFWYKLSDQTKYALLITGSGAIVSVIINLLLVPIWGITGSALSHVIAYSGMLIISFTLGKRYYEIDYDLKNMFFYTVLAAFIFGLGYYAISSLNLVLKLSINTLLLVTFVYLVNKKENLISTFLGKAN